MWEDSSLRKVESPKKPGWGWFYLSEAWIEIFNNLSRAQSAYDAGIDYERNHAD